MPKFISTRRGVECPVCGDISGDCRIVEENVLCHSHIDFDAGVAGWKHVKATKDGIWGIFVPDNGGGKSWQDTIDQRTQRRALFQEREAAKHKNSLTVEERDREFRKLISQLELDADHRQNLRDRGLTDEQIEAGQFRSVRPDQSIRGISPQLPGVNWWGNFLQVAGRGILCPAYDVERHIIGCQIRLDKSTEGGKYRWLKSRNSSHLANGELPLTVCRPTGGKAQKIGLIEGILKPGVTAQLSGDTVFIGASGGNFQGCPGQLKETLAKVSAELGTKTIEIHPDANGLGNSHVFKRDLNTVKLVKSWGYSVVVGYWGQGFDKAALDYDELLAVGQRDKVRFISIDEYKAESDRFTSQPKKEEQKSHWAAAYPDRVRGEWLRLSRLTSKLAEEICQRFLNLNPQTDFLPGVNAWASPMGTGKTHNLEQIVGIFAEGNILSYRNSLLINTCDRISGVEFIWDLDGSGNAGLDKFWKRATNWTALCVDSLSKVPPKDVLVLEEASKLINHLLRGNTCKKERASLLKRFELFCQKATHIFLLDADLSDTDLRYVQSLVPDKPVHVIRNTFQPWQWQITWFVGGTNSKGYQPNDRAPIDAAILDSIAAGQIPLIFTDSQTYGETIDRLLKQLYPDLPPGLRVDSFTKADDPDTVNAFLTNPNQWTERNKPSWVICSPTAEASLDITVEYFTSVYGVFCGTIDCFSMRQMLGRYRVPVARHVFVKERCVIDNGTSKSPIAKTVTRWLHEYHRDTIDQIALGEYLKKQPLEEGNIFTQLKALSDIADFESETWNNPHLKAMAEYQARDNYQKANLRQTLRELLEGCGHLLHEVVAGEIYTGVPTEKKEVLKDRAQKIADSPDISLEKAREIQRNQQSTSEERFAAQKAFLKEQLPGVDLTADFVYWCQFENRQALSQLRNYFMWLNPYARRQIDQQRWAKAIANEAPFWEISTFSLQIEVLRSIGIEKLLDGKERDKDHEDIQQLFEAALAHKARIKTALNITVHEESDPIYLLSRLLKKIGVTYAGKQYREGKDRYRRYWAVLPGNDEKTQAVLAAYKTRYADFCAPQTPPSFLVSQPEEIESITLKGQLVTEQDIARFLTPESLSDIANDLLVPTLEQGEPEVLAGIREAIPAEALRRASKLLAPDQRATLKRWVLEQNRAS